MSTCNRSHRFMLRAIDPSKTETSFHLLISNLGWITFLEKNYGTLLSYVVWRQNERPIATCVTALVQLRIIIKLSPHFQ